MFFGYHQVFVPVGRNEYHHAVSSAQVSPRFLHAVGRYFLVTPPIVVLLVKFLLCRAGAETDLQGFGQGFFLVWRQPHLLRQDGRNRSIPIIGIFTNKSEPKVWIRSQEPHPGTQGTFYLRFPCRYVLSNKFFLDFSCPLHDKFCALNNMRSNRQATLF